MEPKQVTYTPNIVTQNQFIEYEKIYLAVDEKEKDKAPYVPTKLVLLYQHGASTMKMTLVVMKSGTTVHISENTLLNCAHAKGQLTAPSIPGFTTFLFDFLRDRTSRIPMLNFTAEETQTILYPLTKACASGIIRAFYNGRQDPLERIRSLGKQDTSEEVLVLLYYLCCIKYISDLNIEDSLSESDNFKALLDEESIVAIDSRNRYRAMKDEIRQIPANHICLHAVYGAYVMCRPVASKMDFATWIKKRYSALVSSMQQTPDPSEFFQIQAGGTLMNSLSSVRPLTKRLVYEIIRTPSNDPKAATVRTHIKMLTALSEMTTYSMINKVIIQGRSAITLQPNPKQLIKYVQERQEVMQTLQTLGEGAENIVYIHLIQPNLQCFKSTDYPDLVLTALTLEKYLEPKSKTTLDNYKAKLTTATLNENVLTQFFRHQGNDLTVGTMTSEERASLEASLGISMGPLIDDAEKVISLLNRQNQTY